MRFIFKNTLVFSILFFTILSVDLFLKANSYDLPYRYFTKTALIFFVGLFYYFNKNKAISKFKNRITYLALTLFLVADLILINSEDQFLYLFGLSVFLLGKLMYAVRFSNDYDFNLVKLIPFFLFCILYMFSLLFIVFENLDTFFVTALVYLFACLIVALFSYMRLGSVNKLSFILVLLGILCSILSDTFAALGTFYSGDTVISKVVVMLFYALSQYFIVIGLAKEELKALNY